MPKTTANRRGRFQGPYHFALPDLDEDSSDRAIVAHGTPHTPKTGSKPRLKRHELVFLVSWLDYCISTGDDNLFQESLFKEFKKTFGRVVNARTAAGKDVVNVQ